MADIITQHEYDETDGEVHGWSADEIRTLLFALVQAILALIVIAAFVYMSVAEITVNTEFGIVGGTIIGFFFESTYRSTRTRPQKATAVK